MKSGKLLIVILATAALLLCLALKQIIYIYKHPITAEQLSSQQSEDLRVREERRKREEAAADAKGMSTAQQIVDAMGYIQDRTGACYGAIIGSNETQIALVPADCSNPKIRELLKHGVQNRLYLRSY